MQPQSSPGCSNSTSGSSASSSGVSSIGGGGKQQEVDSCAISFGPLQPLQLPPCGHPTSPGGFTAWLRPLRAPAQLVCACTPTAASQQPAAASRSRRRLLCSFHLPPPLPRHQLQRPRGRRAHNDVCFVGAAGAGAGAGLQWAALCSPVQHSHAAASCVALPGCCCLRRHHLMAAAGAGIVLLHTRLCSRRLLQQAAGAGAGAGAACSRRHHWPSMTEPASAAAAAASILRLLMACPFVLCPLPHLGTCQQLCVRGRVLPRGPWSCTAVHSIGNNQSVGEVHAAPLTLLAAGFICCCARRVARRRPQHPLFVRLQ